MKIPLRYGPTALSITRAGVDTNEKEERRFTDAPVALHFLSEFLDDAAVLASLRRALFEDYGLVDVLRMSARELLWTYAGLLASGVLRVVAHARPPLQMHVHEDATSAGGPVASRPAEDAKPSPIVPVEYIILARREADEVLGSTARLVAELEALLYGGFGRTVMASLLAPEFVSVAKAESARLALSIDNVSAGLGQLVYRASNLPRPASEVAQEYKAFAKVEAAGALSAARGFAASLAELAYEPEDLARPGAEVAGSYKKLAEDQAARTMASVRDLAADFSALLYKGFTRPAAPAEEESSPAASET